MVKGRRVAPVITRGLNCLTVDKDCAIIVYVGDIWEYQFKSWRHFHAWLLCKHVNFHNCYGPLIEAQKVSTTVLPLSFGRRCVYASFHPQTEAF